MEEEEEREEAEWEKREDEVMRQAVEGCGGGRKDCQVAQQEAGADRYPLFIIKVSLASSDVVKTQAGFRTGKNRNCNFRQEPNRR